MLDAYTLLGALAARTSRVRLGAMVTGVTYRNPAHLAKIVTTLDVISAGPGHPRHRRRLVRRRARGAGLRLPARRRAARPAGGGAADLPGHVHRGGADASTVATTGSTRRATCRRRCSRAGRPILVGGGGEKRTLQLVARYADMANIVGDAATVAHKVDVLRGHCKAVGRDPAEVTVSRLSTLVLTASAEETAATKDFLRQVTGEEPTGSDIGTPDELVARVEELAAAGVEYFIFNMPTGTPDTVRQVGELLVDRFAD